MEYGDEMNLEVFKTMESALKQDLVCLPLTSFYPFTGCSPDLLSLRLLRLNTVSKVKVKVKSFSRVRLFVTPWTAAHQAPLSMGFSRQEYWSRLPFPSPGDQT